MRPHLGFVARYKLKLKRLDWISPVDEPAQETARVVLIKRGGKLSGYARAVKVAENLGLVFCWAFTSKADGTEYYDLQGDNIDEDFVKAAAEFMERGGGTDEMHDGVADGRVVFAMPMTPEIAAAFGVVTKTTGLMVALKPSAEVLAKFKNGEYTGVSIEGIGERSKVAAKGADMQCEKCGGYVAKDADECMKCGYPMGKRAPAAGDARKATWSTADVDNLPDSAFLYVEPGGKKDDDGKTTPRSLRHFPYKDAAGKIDLAHLRDAIGRIPQSSLPADLRNKLQVKAEKLLAAQHDDSAKRYEKRALLTTAVAGHVHMLDDGGDAPAGETDYRSMRGMPDGGYHSHPWVRSSNGTIVIGESAGHVHEVQTPDDIDQIVVEGDADDDEDDSSKRAPISTRAERARNPGLISKETITMPDAKDTEIAELKKQLADAKRLATLTDAQRAYHGKLPADEAATFLSKSHAERDAVLAEIEKANEVVYTSKSDGTVYRKSDDPRLVAMAKRDDERAVELAKAKADRETEILKARAKSEIGNLSGDDAAKVALLKAVDGIADDKIKTAAIELLKGADAAIKSLGQMTGVNAGATEQGNGPKAAFEAALGTFAKSKNKDPRLVTAEFVATPEGQRLYAAAFPLVAPTN